MSYLCHRDGRVDEQRKIHITPHERRDWVIEGGHEFNVFETDAGRVAILICYDIEFPELGRIAAEKRSISFACLSGPTLKTVICEFGIVLRLAPSKTNVML